MIRFPRLLAVLALIVVPRFGITAEPATPWVVAHRGLLRHAPENTLANFRVCLELRIGFEFDVQKTKDGQLVCIHDESVHRTTNGQGKVADLTLEEIRRLDAGNWFDRAFAGEKVPTVDEVLRLVGEYAKYDVLIAVDLKARGVEEEVVRLAEKYKVLPRLLFIGNTISDSAVRDRLKKASAKTRTTSLANNSEEFTKALETTNADWVYLRFVPTKKQMDAVRTAGKKAFIAGTTVSGNEPDNWQQSRDAGIHGILTDFPLELCTLLRKNRGR